MSSSICFHGIDKNKMSCWTCSLEKEYINPEKVNKNYNKIDKKVEQSKNIGSFMKRSLDAKNFITENNSKNIWENPMVYSSSIHTPNIERKDDIYKGLTTRKEKKINIKNNEDMFLKRSMLGNDFRHGNRFYEMKPTNTRTFTYRENGNENAIKFQNQTQRLFNDSSYFDAYNDI